jgi:hypothetical protein
VLKSPGYIAPLLPTPGDKVMIIGGRGRDEWDMKGYLLPSADGVVRLAHQAADDDRADPPEDWLRRSWPAADVIVFRLALRTQVFV